ncbi:penicillin-binding transpeptidase domain-containing protein [Proteiniclasticum sp. C24MP]|uniref:penicillin-binding transpeptidase domain-containing protein n=1 Tax=Proteiniclasticum sp. C24MP TaxID=3374101 RepID=UPI0037551E81
MKKLLLIIVMIPLVLMLSACDEEVTHDPLETFYGYMEAFESKDFEKMYDLLDAGSKASITEEEYVAVYENIYESVPITDAKMVSRMETFDMERKIMGGASTRIPMDIILTSSAEEMKYSLDVSVVREEDEEGNENYRISHDTRLIYPEYENGDEIVTREVPPLRGEIFDRNMNPVAVNGEVLWVGMVPGRLGTQKNEAIKVMAESLDLTEEYIRKRLGLSWVRDDTFVDMVKVSMEDKAIVDSLTSRFTGIIYRVIEDRVYPYKDATAHLTGYLGLVNAEEYKEMEPLGFPIDTRVGRAGLELLYEEELRGQMGTEVTLLDRNGEVKKVLSTFKNNKGKDLILTIDIDKQVALYDQMTGEMGTASVVNYKSGEVEALVSAPSYDPNAFILGQTQEDYNLLLNDPKKPLLNRFTKLYVPGSTIKPLTAAIALENGALDLNKEIDISGTKWQADESWGNYYVTRVTDPGTPVDIEKAFIYSDNIFFAQMALDMGEEVFLQGMKKFGIGEETQHGFGFETSQISNDGEISSEVLLADSGYGQGQVLFHALTLPKAYTALADKGEMKPLKLFMDEEVQVSEAVIGEEAADQVLYYMTQAVESPQGTGHDAYISGRSLAGKTGTSEIGPAADKAEIGWFSVIDRDEVNPYVTTMMVEDVKGRGGSSVPVKLVTNFIVNYD